MRGMIETLVHFEASEKVEGNAKLKKKFSACKMIFCPYDVSNLVVGKTKDVHAYFNSMNNFDYEWYVFDTKAQMEAGIKQITSQRTWYMTWMRFEVADIKLGSYPELKKGIDLGNPQDTTSNQKELVSSFCPF
jgi:hypothetical protein